MISQEKMQTKRGYKLFPWIVCGLGAIFYCYEYFLRISPSVMTQDLSSIFHINAAQLGNLAAFYYYAYTPMQLPVGILMDRYGPRRLLTLACIVCAIGAYLFSIHVLSVAELGRFLIGFGSAFAFVGVLKLATIWLPPERFALVSGLIVALGSAGAIGGDIALTELVHMIGWHSTVILTSCLGIILAIAMWLIIRDHAQRPRRYEIEQAAGFGELFAGLFKIIKNPQMWVNGFIGLSLYLPITAFAELWGIPYLEQAHHFSDINAASATSMVFLGFGIGGTAAGWVSDRMRMRRQPIIFGGLCAIVTACVLLYVPGIPNTGIYGLLFLLGLFSGAQVIVFAIGRELCSARNAGTALAVTNLFIMLGGALFQPIIGSLLDHHARLTHSAVINGVAVLNNSDYQYALSVVPISLLVATLLTLVLKETAHKTPTQKTATALEKDGMQTQGSTS